MALLRTFCGKKYTGRCLVVKRPGVLSKVQMLNLVLGVGGLFPSSKQLNAWIARSLVVRKLFSHFLCHHKATRSSSLQIFLALIVEFCWSPCCCFLATVLSFSATKE